jgi:acetyl esterase/lipase
MNKDATPEKFKSYHISREQNAVNPTLPTESIHTMFSLSAMDGTSPLAYAVWSKTPIAEQPRSYFQVGGMDPLRDDGLIYHEMLSEAGVPTKIDFYPGCPHGHEMMPGLPSATKASIDCMVGFGWLLEKDVSREDAAASIGL